MKYLTLKQIVAEDRYPFTMGQLRDFLIFRKKNGLFKCVRKIGKKVYLRVDLFEAWIESHNEDKDDK